MDADAVENVGWNTDWMMRASFVSTAIWLATHSLAMISVSLLGEEVALAEKSLSNEPSPFQLGEEEWVMMGTLELLPQVTEGGPVAQLVLKYDQSRSCKMKPPLSYELTRRYTSSFATAPAAME